MTKSAFRKALVLVVLLGSVWLTFTYQQDIRDWWSLRGYQPPPSIAAIADKTAMSEYGRKLFYVSHPAIEGRDSFNQHCVFEEKSLVLGCYASGRIYIFDVTDKRLNGVEEVTAAHEMLHAAYARLKSSEKEKVDKMVAAAYEQIKTQRLEETINGYRKDDPSSVPNELHSILGSEVANLPTELEQYYQKYFIDRSRVTALARDYESVFIEIQDKISAYDKQLASLKSQINDAESQLNSLKSRLDSENKRLTDLRNGGQIAQYNAGVPEYNNLVKQYNSLIATYKNLISQYNDIVKQRNALATEQTDLIKSLDSKYQPIGN